MRLSNFFRNARLRVSQETGKKKAPAIGFLVPSKNPLCIGISGSNFCTNEGSRAFFKLIITSPNNGEHIDIVYNDVLYSIDVVNVAIDDTGWQLPTFGASGVFTFAEYDIFTPRKLY